MSMIFDDSSKAIPISYYNSVSEKQ